MTHHSRTFRDLLESLSKGNSFFAKLRVLTLKYRWHMLVGEAIARRSRIKDFHDGVLIIAVSEGLWAHELGLHRKLLLEKLNRELGASIIRRIRVVVESVEQTEELDEEQI